MENSIVLGKNYLKNILISLGKLKTQGEKSINQIKKDEDLFWLADRETNSIAILVNHLSGNMRSRWKNIFTEDGEKSNRMRPQEFNQEFRPTRSEMMDLWKDGWDILLNTINSLNQDDLLSEIYIRKEPHTVLEAIQRQLIHYANHIGQITFLAKMIEWKNWQTLSIPRNKEVFDYKELKK